MGTEGHTIIFQYPEGILEEDAQVTIRDEEDQATFTVKVNVEPVNDPPEIKALSGINIAPGGSAIIDLNTYAYDPDNARENLSWSIGRPDVSMFLASINQTSNKLRIEGKPTAIGSGSLPITLKDLEGLEDTELLFIEITEQLLVLWLATGSMVGAVVKLIKPH